MPPRSVLILKYAACDRLFSRMCSTYVYGKERYRFGCCSYSFKGFNADHRRTIAGVYSFERPDMTVRMSARFHHLQMKWSLHVLKNFWCQRIFFKSRGQPYECPIKPELRLALSLVIGRDLMTCTDREFITILSRAFFMDEHYERFIGYRCNAPFCIGDFVKNTYFGMPLMRPTPLDEEGIKGSDDLMTEEARASFQRINFRK